MTSYHHRTGTNADFTTGQPDAQRKVVWYENYASTLNPQARDVIRRAFKRAERTTDASITIRLLPDPQDKTATLMARAAIAAGWQDAFDGMHLRLTAQDTPRTHDAIMQDASALGLDVAQFASDLDADVTTERLQEDRALAMQAGFTKGPLLFIDGRLYSGVFDENALSEALEKPLGLRLRTASSAFFEWAAAAGLVLVLATLAALAVVNLGWHSAYEHLRESVLSVGWNGAIFGLTVEQWVNDGLMTFFFLLVGIEIKREIVAGELSDPRRAALPIAAAIGGMAVPAVLFAAINWGTPTVHGWGVPMATDIAFTLGLLALLGSRVPASLRVFLSALAIADDLGAIIVIALFYSSGVDVASLLVALAILAVMFAMNRGRIYALWPYLTLGVFLWIAVFAGGLHATLAGVLTALLIPSRSPASVPGVALQTRIIMEREAEKNQSGEAFGMQSVERLTEVVNRLREPGMHLEKTLENWTNFMILPLFAFFNTGLILTSGAFSITASPSLGVLAGLVLGKPLGIVIASYLVLRSGLATKSPDITWRHLIGVGCLAGIGFTMSIFIAGAAFEGPALDSIKIAVLIASIISAILGMTILGTAPRAVQKG